MKEHEWIFHALIALGTFLAVIVALFGDWFKNRWFKPELQLALLNERGTPTKAAIVAPEKDGGGTRILDSRYYHLVVRNPRRWPVATHVQVFLLQIEEPGPSGALQVVWTGNIPLIWRHQQVFPLARTVGAAAECDFFLVLDKWFSVLTMIQTIEFEYAQKRSAFTGVVFTVQARGAEVDSPVKRFRISWDGQWADGELEMARHLTVEDLNSGAVAQ